MEQNEKSAIRSRFQWGRAAILYNPRRVTSISLEWFQPRFWELRSAVRQQFKGRTLALAVDTPAGPAVLRQFHRGGLMAPMLRDRYLFLGHERSRSFREFDVLQHLFQAGLPVPEPLAALCERSGFSYRAALITREIEGAQALADIALSLHPEDWKTLRKVLDRFFDAGLLHPDLNARNVLRDGAGHWYLIDFDRARVLPGKAPAAGMIARLQRSFKRLGLTVPASALEA
ncbi:MAG: 3-deoxy-D-manno-octulosonic acid kinase [Pseudomonadota bacterium]